LQTKVRVLAIAGALALAGLIFVAATWSFVELIAGINDLSARELSILRTLCLFAPIILICLGLGFRRNRQQRIARTGRDLHDRIGSGTTDRAQSR